ncbi:hypothetical protein METBIDRAFT_219494 [Metschnikowia bicuspidata var. bicuspidata NRRL YB-4993]|uniref:Uncharacterized protein n=1 Tax=Metschnikowia bicuspidata var. bicuspidata NRRL YB-4993 TaxID=869754 RepID=A0A1A0H5E5_9ASCO|nr:hypothetical protein METBIDRAFT_219494 [Metschnikowia bicuspidata var. bicuspidata NRRL YB-4993]OBA19143.1 hypothetical protein METBIDRAFT_219494 [Metschnikowia bicuspidata var. bicuspidata NRRL YB-4993]
MRGSMLNSFPMLSLPSALNGISPHMVSLPWCISCCSMILTLEFQSDDSLGNMQGLYKTVIFSQLPRSIPSSLFSLDCVLDFRNLCLELQSKQQSGD